ncbi:hypothetical protein GQ55_3G264800 [Panicum hallii var. hallii]|jgi:hypothetical protein|uniref:Uncharacterized protein n=1 Tax=Panicum hallii var. hallii TaxID=1504633 RepID=A0A2T7EDL2_9POAL|nr:hypothetical protein GQ55_3G264800 [Panicum hallii var. hallii]
MHTPSMAGSPISVVISKTLMKSQLLKYGTRSSSPLPLHLPRLSVLGLVICSSAHPWRSRSTASRRCPRPSLPEAWPPPPPRLLRCPSLMPRLPATSTSSMLATWTSPPPSCTSARRKPTIVFFYSLLTIVHCTSRTDFHSSIPMLYFVFSFRSVREDEVARAQLPPPPQG